MLHVVNEHKQSLMSGNLYQVKALQHNALNRNGAIFNALNRNGAIFNALNCNGVIFNALNRNGAIFNALNRNGVKRERGPPEILYRKKHKIIKRIKRIKKNKKERFYKKENLS